MFLVNWNSFWDIFWLYEKCMCCLHTDVSLRNTNFSIQNYQNILPILKKKSFLFHRVLSQTIFFPFVEIFSSFANFELFARWSFSFIHQPSEYSWKRQQEQITPNKSETARHGRLHHTRTDPHIFPKPSAIIFRRASIPSGFENIRV